MGEEVKRTEEEWKERLTPEQYEICRSKGTEEPFTGEYWDTTDEGVYSCVACDAELFRSDQKFDAGCGWPSFFDSLAGDRILRTEDLSRGKERMEITCARCGSHLGHVFPDGPEPTGERFCVNSAALNLIKRKEGQARDESA